MDREKSWWEQYWRGWVHIENPGVGDRGRLWHAYICSVSLRAGIHGAERNHAISALDQTPSILLFSPPLDSKCGCCSGPHCYYFYYDCTSWSFCLVMRSTNVSIFSLYQSLSRFPHHSDKNTVSLAKTVTTDESQCCFAFGSFSAARYLHFSFSCVVYQHNVAVLQIDNKSAHMLLKQLFIKEWFWDCLSSISNTVIWTNFMMPVRCSMQCSEAPVSSRQLHQRAN